MAATAARTAAMRLCTAHGARRRWHPTAQGHSVHVVSLDQARAFQAQSPRSPARFRSWRATGLPRSGSYLFPPPKKKKKKHFPASSIGPGSAFVAEVCLLKIDTEGAELRVLRSAQAEDLRSSSYLWVLGALAGLKAWLSRRAIQVIYFEWRRFRRFVPICVSWPGAD